MTLLSRGLVLAALSFGLWGLAGCQEDNEQAVKQQANVGSAPKNAEPPPQSQAEFGRQSMQNNSMSKSGGYPGAKK